MEFETCGIFCVDLEKAWNLQRSSTKKSHSLGVFIFGLRIFKKCKTLLWSHTYHHLQFFENFQYKQEHVGEVFSKTFLQPSCMFTLKQTTDKRIDLFCVLRHLFHCTGIEPLLGTLLNKIVFLLFLNNLLVWNLYVFIFAK